MIVGDDEVKQEKYSLKNMKTGDQYQASLNEIVDYIKK